jgi:Flp pilus assembly CpaF family ATPase
LQEVLSREETVADRARIAQEVADDILGYGPIEPYLRDHDITEVMINGADSIYVERAGLLHKVDGQFNDETHLRRTIDKIVARVGRRIDESSPMVDARLPDGSRINAVVPPLALDRSLLTICKFATDPYTHEDLIGFGSMTRALVDFLAACVTGRLNILVSGGTGAGKTTTLNVLSDFIPQDERIIAIEDAAELQLHQEHVVRLEARPRNIEGRGEIKIRDLVRNAPRMRPDRIVVGEVRDAAALDMLQAMNTRHDGSICTIQPTPPRRALPHRDHGAHGRHGNAGPRHPRAGLQRDRPDRAPSSGSKTAPAGSPTSPRSSEWKARPSPFRRSSGSTSTWASTPKAASSASSNPPACARTSCPNSKPTGSGSNPPSSPTSPSTSSERIPAPPACPGLFGHSSRCRRRRGSVTRRRGSLSTC